MGKRDGPMKNDIRDACSTAEKSDIRDVCSTAGKNDIRDADWINEKRYQRCTYVAPLIGIWEYPKYWVIPKTSGLPEISGNT